MAGGMLVLNAYVPIRLLESQQKGLLSTTLAPSRVQLVRLSPLLFWALLFSSVPTASGIIPQLIEQFHLSEEVATLTLSLFIAGYCVG
jgi:hypothetical protein